MSLNNPFLRMIMTLALLPVILPVTLPGLLQSPEPPPAPSGTNSYILYLPGVINGSKVSTAPTPVPPKPVQPTAVPPTPVPPTPLPPTPLPPTPVPPTPVPPTPTQPPSAPAPFTFGAWADTKTGTATLADLSTELLPLDPVFTVFGGDLEDRGFTTAGMSAWVKAINQNPATPMLDRTFTLRGNHDAVTNTAGWQAHFDMPATATRVGARRFAALAEDLTYAFEYSNALFIIIDVPGDVPGLISAAELAFVESHLSDAEARGLEHAFIFMHGPIYPVGSHNACTQRACATNSTVADLVAVLNRHPIVSAIFNGHEHLNAYVHLDSTRIREITHPVEQFIIGAAGAGPEACTKTYRFDDCGSFSGFATVAVDGPRFTVRLYQRNVSAPVKTYTFDKP